MKALVSHGPAVKEWEDVDRPWYGPAFRDHRFGFDEFVRAYDVFSQAGETGALKVVLNRGS